jgi:hypothetical protein
LFPIPRRGFIKSVEMKAPRAIGDTGGILFSIDIIPLWGSEGTMTPAGFRGDCPWGNHINRETASFLVPNPLRGFIKSVEMKALRAIGDTGGSCFLLI